MEKDRDVLLIAILTFFTVTVWIFFELIKTSHTPTVTANTQKLVVPIQTTFDTDTINVLNQKKIYR
jgi:hypothetical protein